MPVPGFMTYGHLVEVSVPSRLLDEDLRAVALLPPQGSVGVSYPWLWLLHGHGASSDDMRPILAELAHAMNGGRLERHVVVAPDGPWTGRANWWVDSAFAGSLDPPRPPGQPVESAVLTELLPALERDWGAPDDRASRTVGGISMGGAGALRWALVHPHLFSAAVLLSPAVFAGSPPARSSAVGSTAFGRESDPYDPTRLREVLHYPALLAARRHDAPHLGVVIVTGDGEPAEHDEDGEWIDLDLEAARLHAALKREPTITSALRIVPGGHDWPLWSREVVDAVRTARTVGQR